MFEDLTTVVASTPLTSVEKLDHLIAQANDLQLDADQAWIGALLPVVLPHIVASLPRDPDQLDELLQGAAGFLLALCSA